MRERDKAKDSVYAEIEKLKTIVVDFEFQLIQRGCVLRRDLIV